MKTRIPIYPALLASAALMVGTTAWGQTPSPQPRSAASANSGVTVSTVNGRSVVTLNGKEIYNGPTTGLVTSRSGNVNGVESSVVYDEDKMLWESAPGVGEQLMPKPKVTPPSPASDAGPKSGGVSANSGASSKPPMLAPSLSGAAGVNVLATNGQVVITQNGKEVYAGPTAGTVIKRSGVLKGREQFAVYDDDILLWESAPEVGRQLRPQPVASDPLGLDSTPSFMPSLGQNVHSGISVSTVNGQSVVSLNGKEIYRGPATGAVSTRSFNLNGVEYSAVYDGDKLLWENVPGAAKQMQPQPGGAGGGGIDLSQFAEQHRQTVEQMLEAQRQFMQGAGGMAFGTNLIMGGGSQGMSGGSSRQSFGSTSVKSGGGRSGFGQPLPATVSQNSDASITLKTVNGSTVIVYQGREFPVGPTKGNLSAKTKSIQGEVFAAAFEGDRVIWENVPGAASRLK
jgi:hypothetical protein